MVNSRDLTLDRLGTQRCGQIRTVENLSRLIQKQSIMRECIAGQQLAHIFSLMNATTIKAKVIHRIESSGNPLSSCFKIFLQIHDPQGGHSGEDSLARLVKGDKLIAGEGSQVVLTPGVIHVSGPCIDGQLSHEFLLHLGCHAWIARVRFCIGRSRACRQPIRPIEIIYS